MEKKELLKEYKDYNINLSNINLIIEFFEPGKMANSMIEYDDEDIKINNNKIEQKPGKKEKNGFSLFKKSNKVTVRGNGNTVISGNFINGVPMDENIQKEKHKPLKLYLNAASFYDFIISNSVGDILIKNNMFDAIKREENGSVKVTTNVGDVDIRCCEFDNINIKGSTSDITLEDVICKNDTDIKTSTGDISLESVELDSLNAKSSTGDIEINHSEVKSGKAQTSTGDVNTYNSDFIDTIGLYSSTGDIRLRNTTYDKERTLIKTFGSIIER